MCGILGCSQFHLSVNEISFRDSLQLMHHRGPDHTGIAISEDGKLAFGHKRLAVIDLSHSGSQPMYDNTENTMLVLNGEIYNYQCLREELESYNYVFNSLTDTEVLLNGYRHFGMKVFQKLIGMFAVAIYDKKRNELIIARDRAGEKPLFYSEIDKEFFFSSEIKSLLSFSSISNILDPLSINQLFTFGYSNRKHSIYRDIKKLPAGHALVFNLSTRESSIEDYWGITLKIKQSNSTQRLDSSVYVDKLESLLDSSVERQLNADVPVGILLSGGVDSSLITAFAARHKKELDTYTVKFSNSQHSRFDESEHARLISKAFNTNHHELEASAVGPEIIDKLTYYFDEPIFHNSMIPTYLLSKEISKTCTVAIGGDGGDELFGGYYHYNKLLRLRSIANLLPLRVRSSVADFADQFLPIGFKGKKTISLFGSDFHNSYPNVSEFFSDFERRTIFNSKKIQIIKTDNSISQDLLSLNNYISRATFFDFTNYLSEGILVKIDRASMANSLEIRAPFLDKDINEFALLELPTSLKINMTERKIILKKLCERMLPISFHLNRKQGFSMPLGSLLQSGEWHDFFSETITDSDPNIFNQEAILQLLNNTSRIYQNSEKLFGLIFFMAWLKRFKPSL